MEQEELDKLLENEDVKAAIAAQYVLKTDFDKVLSKKDQILAEKKKEQEKTQHAEAELKKHGDFYTQIGQLGFNPDEIVGNLLNSLKAQATNPEGEQVATPTDTKTDANKLMNDRLAIQKQTYESRIDTAKKSYEDKIKTLEDSGISLVRGWDSEKVENTLSSELDRIGVLPKHKKVLKQAFKGRSEVAENEDGVRGVMVSNEDGMRVSASEFFDSFANSDEGKVYISAPATTGGGALGSRGTKNAVDYDAEIQKANMAGDTGRAIALKTAKYRNKK